MNSLKYLGSLVFVLASAAALTGCEIDAGIDAGPDVVVVSDSGSLTVDISVDGREDRFVCGEMGVAAADIRIVDVDGFVIEDVEFDCEDFGGSIDLPEGDYRAEVTLLDLDEDVISTTAIVHGLEVIDDTDLEISVDFPESSML